MNITPKPCIHVTSLSTKVSPNRFGTGIVSRSVKAETNTSKTSLALGISSRNVSISYQGIILKKIFRRVINFIERDFDMKVMTFKKSAVIRNRR